MNVLFIGKEGLDLFETLMDSETSRVILRFYAPQRHPCGMIISASSLGIALSLVSELRWYIRRYMVNVLFELQDGIFGTYALAQEVYERGIRLDGEGIRRSRYHIKNGKIDPVPDIASKTSGCTPDHSSGIDGVLEIWSLETEMGNIFEHINPSTGGDENHLSEEL